jgi:TIR domain/Tetratricopeptide repeat
VTVSHSVFISYARSTSSDGAQRLRETLGRAGVSAFLDTTDLDLGEQIPAGIVEGLFGARVVVVFADETYFSRWYCLREFHVALAAFNALVARGGSVEERNEALLPVVIALQENGARPGELGRLPPTLKTTLWPTAGDPQALVGLVADRLAQVSDSLGKRLEELGELDVLRESVLSEAAIPPPRSLAGIPVFALAGELRPSLGADFVGRSDELWRIHHSLSTMRGEPVAAALTGAIEGGGGFGKTRLAMEYLQRFGPANYQGGLFWVNAEQNLRLEEQLHGILASLRPDTLAFAEFSQAGRSAARELEMALRALPEDRPALYVVDNVPEPEPGESPMPLSTWCPAVGAVTLLVTSRARQSILAGIVSLPVDVLAPRPAVALLTRGDSRRSRLGVVDWATVAAWVGYLPLALELLNASLQARAVEPEELAAMARTHGPLPALDTAAETLRGVVPSGALRGISEALAVSYQRLSPEAQRAAWVLACYAPAGIPLALFQALGEKVATPAVKMLLSTRSFMGTTPASDPKIPLLGRMHPVLAEYLRACSVNADTDLRAANEGLQRLMDAEACRDPEAWPLLNACLPHARTVFEATAPRASTAEPAINLGMRLGILLAAQGLFSEAEGIERRVVDLARSALGDEHPGALTSMSSLAKTLLGLGDLAGARSLQESVLEAQRRILGPEHTDTLGSMGNLAASLHGLGDLAGARSLQEAVLEARRRIFGAEHPDTLRSMGNLALTLGALGDLAGACNLQKAVLEAHRRILGERHSDTTISAWNLLATLLDQGEPEAASLVLRDNLVWLLAVDPVGLGAAHREIRERLAQLFRAASRPTESEDDQNEPEGREGT